MQLSHYERTIVPSLDDEFAATIHSIITGGEPTTVTHALLLETDQPYTREGLAASIGRPTWQIEGTLAALEESGWLTTFVEHGLEKLTLTPPPLT